MRKKNKIFSSFLLYSASVLLFTQCRNDKVFPDYYGYPSEIGEIMLTKCAVSGCHNDASKLGAAGLSLESWDKLFEGGSGSACLIPYRHDYSTLCYYINSYSELGLQLLPTMPYNKNKLSKEEVVLIENWIDAGAPDYKGFVKFSDNQYRKKYYVTNQGCDVVTVFDAETLIPMRFINIGSSAGIESPHMIRVSPDKQYWYVLSLAGQYLEKYRTSDDAFVSKALIGSGNWNAFTISSDSQKAYCTDMNSGGKIATVELATMVVTAFSGLNYPHGCVLNYNNSMLYVTQQNSSNQIYKIPVADFTMYSQINLYTSIPSTTLNPHEIVFSPDGKKYFVTCQGTSEVRILQTNNDSLLSIISVGAKPSEMSISTYSDTLLFVTCTEDTINFPGNRGSIAVINCSTNQFVKYIYSGWQPHGIAVDDSKGLVVVVNRNFSSDGPAPHHSGQCGGRNGNVSFINIQTLDMLLSGSKIKKIEIAADPYSASVR